jgi:hypothetical protein
MANPTSALMATGSLQPPASGTSVRRTINAPQALRGDLVARRMIAPIMPMGESWSASASLVKSPLYQVRDGCLRSLCPPDVSLKIFRRAAVKLAPGFTSEDVSQHSHTQNPEQGAADLC